MFVQAKDGTKPSLTAREEYETVAFVVVIDFDWPTILDP